MASLLGHRKYCSMQENTAYCALLRRWQSGQMHVAVNHATSVSAGSNPARRTDIQERPLRAFLNVGSMDSKAGARRREAGSRTFSAENDA